MSQHTHTQPRSVLRLLGAMLYSALPLTAVVVGAGSLSACGFHLQGYQTPMHFEAAKTAIVIDDDRTSFPLKRPLTRRLESLGVDVVDSLALIESGVSANDTTRLLSNQDIATITVKNVRFKRYELVGVLTEIRLVLSADVTYNTIQNGEAVTLTNPIQVTRSYQYNEASVSTDDQQGEQIRDWLYDSLAQRITDQYVAIGLPSVRQPQPTISSTTTAPVVVAPKP